MLEFEWPWLIAALLLPLLALLLPSQPKPLGSALRVADIGDFSNGGDAEYSHQAQRLRWLLAFAAYAALTLAAMRPVWVGEQIDIPLEGRDLMLALDLSGSMREQDMQLGSQRVSRIWATKRVATEFVEKRVGDRIGLVVFGAFPYLQTPLTFDRKTIIENIEKSNPFDADDIQRRIHGTVIGDAIGLAVKRLRENKIEEKTLILITDGADSGSKIPPLKAAELAAKDGLKIYTIGVGADRQTASLMGFNFNMGRNSEIDESTLQQIADITGGQYFRARDTEELQNIYTMIDQLEPVQSDAMSFKPRKALFSYPLALALLIASLLILSSAVTAAVARRTVP